MPVLVEQNTQTRLSCVLISSDDYETPMTGVLYNDANLVVKYAKYGDSALSTKTLGSSDWIELGEGVYDIVFSATELDTLGEFKFVVLYENVSGVKSLNYYGKAQVVSELWGKNSDVQAIKAQTDKLQFDGSNNVQARVNNKGVLNDPSVTDIDNQLTSSHGSGSWESADISDLALETTAQAIKNKTDNLPSDPASQSQVESAISSSESNIRGVDNDTLKTLSDQLDTVQADLDNPDQYKADISALAIEANVETHVTNALNAYDPPTRAEATSDKNEIITQVQSSESNIRGSDNDDLKTLSDQLDIVQADLDDPDQYKADVSSLALEANVETHVTNALNSYDPPTKAELDQAESNIRGSDGDTLKTLSDQLDAVQSDLDDPDQYKADVSNLALESTAQNIKVQTDKIPTIEVDVSFIKDIEGGRWVRDGHQMIFYKDDNVTEVARFDLYKADGTLAEESDEVFERKRV